MKPAPSPGAGWLPSEGRGAPIPLPTGTGLALPDPTDLGLAHTWAGVCPSCRSHGIGLVRARRLAPHPFPCSTHPSCMPPAHTRWALRCPVILLRCGALLARAGAHGSISHCGPAASGPEDVALYVGLIAVAVCLVLLLLVGVLVYCRKKEGLDADVADSSILTAGFQPVSIKPSKAGGWHWTHAGSGGQGAARGSPHPRLPHMAGPATAPAGFLLCHRQLQPAHHPARPQHHHHDLPGLTVPAPGWAWQVPAEQRAPTERAGRRAPHAAPQLAQCRGRGLCDAALHPELLPLPAPRHRQCGLWHFQLPGWPAHDPQHG